MQGACRVRSSSTPAQIQPRLASQKFTPRQWLLQTPECTRRRRTWGPFEFKPAVGSEGHNQLYPMSPVTLAPMSGITDSAFRQICREQGGGIYVSEMVHARLLVEQTQKSNERAFFADTEAFRSLQLYTGRDPSDLRAAVHQLAAARHVDHIDLNFGCPVKKVLKKGGGAAIPKDRALFGALCKAAVEEANLYDIPVTIKFRLGLDDSDHYFLDCGRIAEESGVASVCLHARTATDLYGPPARWHHIAELRSHIGLPVWGNGDVFCAEDAVSMIQETGCDGVTIGRGCLGSPWLFRDIDMLLRGQTSALDPTTLQKVASIATRHAHLAVEHAMLKVLESKRAEDPAKLAKRIISAHRKHIDWYLSGFQVDEEAMHACKQRLNGVATLIELEEFWEKTVKTLGPELEWQRLNVFKGK